PWYIQGYVGGRYMLPFLTRGVPTRIYSVSGRDAVELMMSNGRGVRIVTDEPEELEAALKRAINASRLKTL
ncbi:MAG: hypothetical protein WDZ44_00315, partial [Candidatus Spechtbacterales bacterium]